MVKLVIGGLIPAIIGGLLAAIFTYYVTAKLNHESAVQQQYLVAVQDFTSTGARVDAGITELSDALLDKDGVVQARKDARQAIAAHVAATESLQQVIGKGNKDAYMEGLATLREYVDQTGDVNTALRTSRARFQLMENRTIIVNEARRRIFDKS